MVATCLVAALPFVAHAACPNEGRPYDLAHWLRGRQEFFRAAGIYLELLERSPNSAGRLTALGCLTDTYVEAGQLNRAAEVLYEARRLIPAGSPGQSSLLLNLAMVHIRAGNYDDALSLLSTESLRLERPLEADYVRGLAWAGQRKWSVAREVMNRIASQCTKAPCPESVGGGAQRALVRLREPPSEVRPWLAMGLSAVIPGSGFLYTRHPIDALYYGGGVGLGVFLTYDTISWNRSWRHQRASTYILGALTLLFYTSNIVASHGTAQRLNQVRSSRFQQGFLDEAALPSEPLKSDPENPDSSPDATPP